MEAGEGGKEEGWLAEWAEWAEEWKGSGLCWFSEPRGVKWGLCERGEGGEVSKREVKQALHRCDYAKLSIRRTRMSAESRI